MIYPADLSPTETASHEALGMDLGDAARCPAPVRLPGLGARTPDLCNAGCPLAPLVQDRLRFEALLAELSATFSGIIRWDFSPARRQ